MFGQILVPCKVLQQNASLVVAIDLNFPLYYVDSDFYNQSLKSHVFDFKSSYLLQHVSSFSNLNMNIHEFVVFSYFLIYTFEFQAVPQLVCISLPKKGKKNGCILKDFNQKQYQLFYELMSICLLTYFRCIGVLMAPGSHRIFSLSSLI